MNRVLPLLIWRYLRGTRDEHTISTMIKLSFVSMLLGSGALALVMAIMNGFEKVTHEKMQGIHAQIIIRIPEEPNAYETIRAELAKSFPTISAYAPQETRQLIVNNPGKEEFETVALKAIDPINEAKTSVLESKIRSVVKDTDTPATPTLAHLLTQNRILIGDKLAEQLDLKPGDTVNLLFPGEGKIKSTTIHLHGSTAIVGGTFSTGIEEFDAGMVICSFSLLNELFPHAQPSQISLKLTPGADEQQTINQLKEQFPESAVYSWKELYPALMAALILEKYAMFFILSLIMLVACMNIVSLLFMQITQKRADIAIMKAMGMSDGDITTLFVWLGMSISLCATVLGLALACIASWFLEHYPFITLPDVYFVTHLPARMEWGLLAQVFVVIMLISFLATWFPAQKTRSINISDVLRFEA